MYELNYLVFSNSVLSLTELESMTPYERDAYMKLYREDLKRKADEAKNNNG